MEWVETTGRSVQEAKDKALDELGVDESDAEFEVLAEAQTGLFGRLRSEARVRARVRPTAPRPKDDRRDRRRRNSRSSGATGSGGGSASSEGRTSNSGRGGHAGRSAGDPASTDTAASGTAASGDREGDQYSEGETGSASTAGGGSNRGRRRGGRSRHRSVEGSASINSGSRNSGDGRSGQVRRSDNNSEDGDGLATKGTGVEVDLDRQADVAVEFLNGLTREFGLKATVGISRPDEDTVELQLTGSDLGILIGPKGATLIALQNLTRTVVFNETGGNNGHIDVDVAGYRQKRSEALARFATQIAGTVKETGERTALEPMSSLDRKVVHDTISHIDGVTTVSEGEDPRRRVVVLPA